ncbi:MAG: hypothetical protein KBT27_09165 [Prevotellaceae bacterium]|nr:hypothetical protein [Candidatus Faecinaster equi]
MWTESLEILDPYEALLTEKKMIWEVWYFIESDKISKLVEANSFDEALAMARAIDSRYSYGRMIK